LCKQRHIFAQRFLILSTNMTNSYIKIELKKNWQLLIDTKP
jgi:hypothetical protein